MEQHLCQGQPDQEAKKDNLLINIEIKVQFLIVSE